MKKYISIFVFILLVNTLFAKIVPIETAQQVAVNFYTQKYTASHTQINAKDIYISDAFTISENNAAVYYIFTVSDFGYIVISAEDNTIPVLAYSFESTYNPKYITPPFQMWMDEYKTGILSIRENNFSAGIDIKKAWTDLLQNTFSKSTATSVAPFVNSKWDQSEIYNIKCPADNNGPGGHCVTGCVATCLGQLMYYYRFPEHGTASYSYTHPVYGMLSADFQNTYYNWNAMSNIPTKPSAAIGDLIFQSGVGVDMNFGPNSSGMYNHSAAYVLKTYFRYSPDVRYVYRDSTNLRWDSLMVAQLNKKMPLYYAGWSVPNINGHAFVCDGYQDTTYFHFNFGWGGLADGYFYVNALSPGGNNFNLAQELIINIYPDTASNTYPVNCNGPKTIIALEGSIEDGSGPIADYQTNSNCTWLISPIADSISSLKLTFSKLNTKNNHGIVKVYNGNSTSAPLIGSFSGDSIPASITINNKQAFVCFTSDADTVKSGFFINYAAIIPEYCIGYKTMNATAATFGDGSNSKKYNPNTYCKWLITPNTPTESITLHFNNFNTEANKDILRIISTFPDVVLATFSGTTIPQDFTINDEDVFIEWITDYENEMQGWDISYTSSGVGINTIEGIKNILIYPNPTQDILNITLNSTTKQNIVCELFSMEGKLIYSEKWNQLQGETHQTIHLNNIQSGIYLLQLTNDQMEVSRQKIVRR